MFAARWLTCILTLCAALGALAADRAYIVNAVTFVPIASIAYGTGNTQYDAKTKTITLATYNEPQQKLKFAVGSTKATLDGKDLTLEAAPFLLDGNTFVPVGALNTALGVTIAPDDKTAQLTIKFTDFMGTAPLVTRTLSPEDLALRQRPITKEKARAIFNAVRGCKTAEIAALLKANPELRFAKDDVGDLPLHSAIRFGLKTVAEALLANGAYIDDYNNSGQTALHIAVRPWGFRYYGDDGDVSLGELIDIPEDAPMVNSDEMVAFLLDKGASLKAVDDGGLSPLHTACGEDDSDGTLIAYLVDKGAELSACDDQGQTPLFHAAHAGNTPIIDLLITRGAVVNAKDSAGNTPLHEAAEWGKTEAARALIKKGAKVAETNEDGETPFYKAAGSVLSNNDTAALLLQCGADINTKNANGETPLFSLVAMQGDAIAGRVKFLLDRGAKVDIKDNDNRTPLHAACMGGNASVVKLLIAKGAKVNVKDDYDSTPLSIATERDAKDIVKILKQAGAK